MFRLPEIIVDQDRESGLAVLFRGSIRVLNNVKISSLKKVYVFLLYSGTPIGISFVGIGVIILLTGAQRFFHIQKALIRSVYIPSRVEGLYLL